MQDSTLPQFIDMEGEVSVGSNYQEIILRPEATAFGGTPANSVAALAANNEGSKIFKVWTGLPAAWGLRQTPGNPNSTTCEVTIPSLSNGGRHSWMIHIPEGNVGGAVATVKFLAPGSSWQVPITANAELGQYSTEFQSVLDNTLTNIAAPNNWVDTPPWCCAGATNCVDSMNCSGIDGDCDDILVGTAGVAQINAANTHQDYALYGDNPACGRQYTSGNIVNPANLAATNLAAGGDIIAVVCYDDQNLAQVLRSWGYNL